MNANEILAKYKNGEKFEDLAKTYSEETEYPLPLSKIQEFEKRYQQIIEEGYRENPLKLHEKNTDSVRLLNRLSKRQEEVLEFLYQVEVPFDNNLAERDRVPILSERKVSTFDGQ